MTRRLYPAFLRLYPYDYRSRFEAEMLASLLIPGDGRRPVRELAGLLRGAIREWIDKWTTPEWFRGRRLPDLRMMRPVGVTKREWFGEPPVD